MRSLTDHWILVVKDETLIALDVQECLESEGAFVLLAATANQAAKFTDRPGLSAAVIDDQLGAEYGPLCELLSARGIPFLVYSDADGVELHRPWSAAPVMSKAVPCHEIVAALRGLLAPPFQFSN